MVLIFLKFKRDSLLKIIDAQKETYEKEKEAILDAEIEKKKMTEKVDKEYQETVEKFKVLHQIQRKELTEEKEKEIKKIIKKNYNKPEKMTKELSDMFGIIHVPKINNDNN
jgi:sortase (surface protein transpeptidase)